ncbi:LPS assembly lipoprotein LptE [Methylophaga sp. OBS4]|uniref:LPS-assembly lipoprotein LptE n=1 Tax=Methylophaga sp. OBS4 TaxID=2991935 RepID=UPI002251FF2D|nr:LPS assembly lipoprotein LptE [Methylophaga sp. OBS4]MCX4187594.1 LPS assembly lipoprotein LptE [Methylophaga sp. OBS4]
MKHVVSKVGLGFLLLALAGCGFHLRGEATVPEALKTMYLQGVNTQQDYFGLELKRALTRNGIVVLDEYQEGAAIFTVLENRYQRHVLSVGSDAKVREFELEAWVRFQVTDDKGKPMSEVQRVEARRDYQFDRNQVLAMDEQERVLREALNKQLVNSILRRLSAMQ